MPPPNSLPPNPRSGWPRNCCAPGAACAAPAAVGQLRKRAASAGCAGDNGRRRGRHPLRRHPRQRPTAAPAGAPACQQWPAPAAHQPPPARRVGRQNSLSAPDTRPARRGPCQRGRVSSAATVCRAKEGDPHPGLAQQIAHATEGHPLALALLAGEYDRSREISAAQIPGRVGSGTGHGPPRGAGRSPCHL